MLSVVGVSLAAGTCALFGLHELYRARRLLRIGREARATIIEDRSQEDDDSPMPVFRFETDLGEAFTVREKLTTLKDATGLGTKIVILYDPEDPQNARRKTGRHLWGPGILWLSVGGLLAIVAVVKGLTGN